MLTQKELLKVYETVLRSPGMGDLVKINLTVNRRNVWMLVQLVEKGMGAQEAGLGLPTEWMEELTTLVGELLKKADLVSFSESLKELGGGK